jgi:predicted  nucleic acid-binding Zn-ribbon protein
MPTSNKRKGSNGCNGENGGRKKQPRTGPSDKNDATVIINRHDDIELKNASVGKLMVGTKKKNRRISRQNRISTRISDSDSDKQNKTSNTNGFSPISRGAAEKDHSLNHVGIAVGTNRIRTQISQNGESTKIMKPSGYPNTPGRTKLRKRNDTVEVENTTRNVLVQEVEEDHCQVDAGTEFVADSQKKSTVTNLSWVYYTIRLGVIFSLIFATISVYQTHVTSQWIEGTINTEMQEMQASVDSLQWKLNATRSALDLVEGENTQCKHSLQTVQVKNEKSDEDVLLLQKRLDFVVGSEDSVQASLSNAWNQIEQLKLENHDISILLNTSNANLSIEREAKSVIEDEQRICSDRVVELELEAIETDGQIADGASKFQEHIKEKNDIELKLNKQQDLAALLQHQLDEENGHTWYYELQVQYLESSINDIEGVVSDLKFEKAAMENEIRRLRNQILIQNNEAVAALNAVARSATYRKAEQFALMESAADRRVENVKTEAVKAVNSVLTVMMSKE